jgi:ribosome-associated heat shock protein Hsp15
VRRLWGRPNTRPVGSAPRSSSTRGMLAGVAGSPGTTETRVDRWLCAVRLVKTRLTATQLCGAGHVRVNGNIAKPSTRVRAGDRIDALIAGRERIVEVVRPIESRVGAPVAVTCYVDHSPPPVVREVRPGIMAVRGEGRPGRRLRRELERLRRGD